MIISISTDSFLGLGVVYYTIIHPYSLSILCIKVRMGRRPVFVDLDVGQGSISVPGSLGEDIILDHPSLNSEFYCFPFI